MLAGQKDLPAPFFIFWSASSKHVTWSHGSDLKIIFSMHSKLQTLKRGALETEVIETIKTGEEAPAKLGRKAYARISTTTAIAAKNFPT